MRAVCQTDVVPLPHGQAPDVPTGGRFSGRWRYRRAAGRGIALSYERSVSGSPTLRPPDVHSGGRFTGRWRYNRSVERGIALSYGDVSAPPVPLAEDPAPTAPATTHAGAVRVLCSCGVLFAFDGDGGVCPGCGRPAEWPTMGEIEREMRADLEAMLRAHEPGADPG